MALVSAIIPAYNAEATIAEAIDSALRLASVECDLEVVAVDDGSTDATPAILKSYGGRIKSLRQRNSGVSAARNHAARESRGEYLAFLDADDFWLPGRLAKTVGALEADPGAGLAFSDFYFNAPPNKVTVGDVRTLGDMLERLAPMMPTTVTIRRRVFDSCGGFDESLKFGEDYLLWLAAARRGTCRYVPETLAVYRSSDGWDRLRRHAPENKAAFARALSERYGRRAAKLTRAIRNEYALSLLARALHEFDRGARARALRTFLEAARNRPSFLLKMNPAKLLRRGHSRAIRQIADDRATHGVSSRNAGE